MSQFTNDFNSIFEGLTLTSAGGKGEEIYKENLFKGMTQEQKKKARTKLRRTRDKYLTHFVNCKGKVSEAFKKEWQNYAVKVYTSVDNICSANTDGDTRNLCVKFCEAMTFGEKKEIKK